MRKAIVTLVMALALVGFAGFGGAMAATPQAPFACVSTPAYTDYVNVHSVQCPVGAHRRGAPRVMGAVGF